MPANFRVLRLYLHKMSPVKNCSLNTAKVAGMPNYNYLTVLSDRVTVNSLLIFVLAEQST